MMRRTNGPASAPCWQSWPEAAPVQGPADHAEFAGRDFCRSGEGRAINLEAIKAIYRFEMACTFRTPMQSIISPVISTSLNFVVFGAAIGSRITEIEGVSYGAFIVPRLIMLMILTQNVSNGSFGIFFPKFLGGLSTNCCRRRFPISRSSSAMSARPRPSR